MNDAGGPRTVVDTNQVVSAVVNSHGLPGQLVAAWQRREFRLLMSPALQHEIADVLKRDRLRRRFRLTMGEVEQPIARLSMEAELVTPMAPADLPVRCRDPKDDVLLACALSGRARYLVTGDGDLLVLNGAPALGNLTILHVREFLEALRERR
jgi:putative PIN family toxin of toxin-antitoxin system